MLESVPTFAQTPHEQDGIKARTFVQWGHRAYTVQISITVNIPADQRFHICVLSLKIYKNIEYKVPVSLMAMIARGNTALLNKILSWSRHRSVTGSQILWWDWKWQKNKVLEADVLHLGSYSFRLGDQIADEVRSSEVLLLSWPIWPCPSELHDIKVHKRISEFLNQRGLFSSFRLNIINVKGEILIIWYGNMPQIIALV